jgi:hypothetical protein
MLETVPLLLGPERSAPYMQALNAFVGVGFMLGSLIIRPFLPKKEEDSSICGIVQEKMMTNLSFTGIGEDESVSNVYTFELTDTVPAIVLPFLIIAAVHILTGLAFFVIGWFISFNLS